MQGLGDVESPEELIGRDVAEWIAEEDRERVRETTLAGQRGEEAPGLYEFTVVRADGGLRRVEASASLVRYRGRPASLSFLRDVTERRQREDQLRERALLLDSTTDSIVLRDLSGNFIYVNEAAYSTRGYSRDEFMKLRPHQLLTTDGAIRLELWDKELMEKGEAIIETTHLRKDGSLMPVEVHARIIELGGRKLALGVIRDITERRRAEEELRESEERYRILVEDSPNAISVTVGDEIVYANRRRAELAGKDDPSELVGTSAFSQVVEGDREIIAERRAARERGEEATSPFAYRMLRADGRVRDILNYSSAIRYQGKNAVQHALLDVTEEKRYEARLEALHGHAADLSEAETVEEIAEQTLETVEKLLGYDHATYSVVEGGVRRIISIRGMEAPLPPDLPLDGRGVTVRAIMTGETQIVPDTRLDEDYVGVGGAGELLSELAVPVKAAGGVVGVINVEWERLDAFTEQDRMLVEMLAGHVASAYSRLRRMQEQVEFGRKLEALHLNARRLSAAMDLPEVYDVTLETMEHTLGLSRGNILMVEGEVLRQVAQSELLPPGLELPLDGGGVTVRAVREGRSILVPDVRECEDYVYARDLPASEAEEDSADSLSELAVPIVADGEPIGVLNLESVELDAFDDQDVELVELLASHTALAMSRIRNQEMILASEERFRGIAERSSDLIFTVDPEGRFAYVSPASERITGYPPDEVVGKHFHELLPASEMSRVTQAFAAALSGRIDETFPAEVRRRDGSSAFLEVNISPITKEGERVGFQGVARDVTGRREMDRRLRVLAYRLNGLQPGGCFTNHSNERCLKAYADLTMHGVPGLCIAREDPETLISHYGISRESILIVASRPIGGFEAVSDLQGLSRVVSGFLGDHEAPVVLLDGLEYIVTRHGFDAFYQFIQEKRFDFLEAGAVLLVILDPATLTEREKALLAAELKTLE